MISFQNYKHTYLIHIYNIYNVNCKYRSISKGYVYSPIKGGPINIELKKTED